MPPPLRGLARFRADIKKKRWTLAFWALGMVGLAGAWLVAYKLPIATLASRVGHLTVVDQLHVESDLRGSLIQVAGGAFLGVSGYLGYRTLKLNREASITQTFGQAMAQLAAPGPTNYSVRIGGIYSLERIARSSADDQGVVVEALCAHVRDISRASPRTLDLPGGETQTIIKVLARRTRRDGDPWRIDLHGTDLRGTEMGDGKFQRTNFDDSLLKGCLAWGADFRGALFRRTDLTEAILGGALVEGADFTGAILVQTRFEDIDLRKTIGLTQTQIDSARIGPRVILPPA